MFWLLLQFIFELFLAVVELAARLLEHAQRGLVLPTERPVRLGQRVKPSQQHVRLLGDRCCPGFARKTSPLFAGLDARASSPGARGWREGMQQISKVVSKSGLSSSSPHGRVLELSLPSGPFAPQASLRRSPPVSAATAAATTEIINGAAAPTLK